MAREGITAQEQAASTPVAVLDADGNPRTCIVAQASELVGLPNYSNITVGPTAAFRWVKDNGDHDLLVAQFEALYEVVAEVTSKQRRILLTGVQAFAEQGGYNDVRNSQC